MTEEILDFADARTVRVPRKFSAPSRISDFGLKSKSKKVASRFFQGEVNPAW
jgi:hypothetical protein